MTQATTNPIARSTWLVIIVIAIVAALVRFVGIWHEYPFSFYGDEQQMVKQALAYGGGNFNPYETGMNASKPAFYTYLLFVEYGIYFVIGKLAGWWQDAAGYVTSFLHRPGPWYVIGRSTTALFGVATIILVAITGEKYFSRRSGLVAAILMTVAMGHVITCQHVKADNPTAFFSLLAMLFLLAFLSARQRRYLILAAIAAGFGMATKYYSVFLAPMFAIAIVVAAYRGKVHGVGSFLNGSGQMLRYILLATVVGFATFFLLTPYTFLDSQGLDFLLGEISVLGDKAVQLTGAAESEAARDDYEFRGHATYTIAVRDFAYSLGKMTGFGWFAAITGCAGIVYCLLRINVSRLILISFPIVFTVVAIIVRPGFAVVRHQTQIYPFLAIAAGIMLVALYGWIVQRKPQLRHLLVVVFLFLLAPQLVNIIERANVVSRSDTRSAAVAWVNENLPVDSHVLIGNAVIELVPSLQTLDDRERSVEQLIASGKVPDSVIARTSGTSRRVEFQRKLAQQVPAFRIRRFEHPWWLRRHNEVGERFFLDESDVFMEPPTRKFGVSTLDEYASKGVEFIIVGDEFRNFYKRNVERYPPYNDFYDSVYRLNEVASFHRHESGWGGDTVRIFAMD